MMSLEVSLKSYGLRKNFLSSSLYIGEEGNIWIFHEDVFFF